MSDDRRQSAVSQFFYDSKAGTVMGRTGRSWAKILLFYAIYYSFLAIIFFVSLETMKAISKPTESKTRLAAPTQSRLDQPGLTVYPHQENRDDNDGLLYPVCFGKDFVESRYYQDLETFFESYDDKSVTNFTSPDVKEYIKNWKETVEKGYTKNKFTVFLALNKVLNFELTGVTSLKNTTGDFEFEHKVVLEQEKFDKDSAYFNCLSLNEKGEITKKSADSTATIDLANTKPAQPGRIAVKDYNDQAKKLKSEEKRSDEERKIVKPFVAFEVDFNKMKKGDKQKFVCFPIAGNINNSEQSDKTREKYGKNGLGKLEFGFEIFDADDDKCDKVEE